MDQAARIAQARLVARELWALMRDDASHRLGVAHAFPEANDLRWSPQFYRRCQLAERLFAILDDLANGTGAVCSEAVTAATAVQEPAPAVQGTTRTAAGSR
jgi:hypothetical protein